MAVKQEVNATDAVAIDEAQSIQWISICGMDGGRSLLTVYSIVVLWCSLLPKNLSSPFVSH